MRHFWKLRHIYETETFLENILESETLLENETFLISETFLENETVLVNQTFSESYTILESKTILESETILEITYQFMEFALLPKWYNWSFCEFSGWIQSWSIWMTAGPSSDLPEPLGFWLLQSINKHKSMAQDSLKNIRINMNGSCNCCMVGWRMVTNV